MWTPIIPKYILLAVQSNQNIFLNGQHKLVANGSRCALTTSSLAFSLRLGLGLTCSCNGLRPDAAAAAIVEGMNCMGQLSPVRERTQQNTQYRMRQVSSQEPFARANLFSCLQTFVLFSCHTSSTPSLSLAHPHTTRTHTRSIYLSLSLTHKCSHLHAFPSVMTC